MSGRPKRGAALKAAAALANLSDEEDIEAAAPSYQASTSRAASSPGKRTRLTVRPPAGPQPVGTSGTAQASFTDLPNEIMHDILLRLPSPLSVLRMSITCKRLQAYCDDRFFERCVSEHYKQSVAPGRSGRDIVLGKLSIMCQVCEGCEKVASRCNLQEKNVCSTCGQLITVTKAKSEWKVNDKEIAHLCYESRANPHYRSSAPMRLYSVLQIKQVSDAKWAAKNTTLEERKSKLAASPRKNPKDGRSTRLDVALAIHGLDQSVDVLMCQEYIRTGHGDPSAIAQVLADRKSRKTALQSALRARGLRLRDDSKLCEDYIDGYGFGLAYIVSTMMQMHLAFEHSVVGELREQKRQELREQYELDQDPRFSIGGHDRYYDRKAEFYEEWEGARDDCTREAVELYEAAVAAGATGPSCECGRPLIDTSNLA